MTKERLEYLKLESMNERLSYGEIAEIEDAFSLVPDSALSDSRENALASDMLNVIEASMDDDSLEYWMDAKEETK